MSAEDFKKKSRQLVSKAKEELQKYKGNCEISLFSPWFSEFTTEYSSNSSSLDHKLLLPSMAVAGSKSSCVHDVEIIGFGKTVTIFSSKQKPKKLTIYAANFATHEFIVKGGEELRIDQRVQQLFNVMNGLVSQAHSTNSNDLKICTYDVIPMSPNLGLMAFVNGTRPLEHAMVPGTVSEGAYKKSTEVFQRFINGKMGGYSGIFRSSERNIVVENFEKAEKHLPWQGLREALVKFSGSMEGFMQSREIFLKSLATSSIMGYIAGVGDRHLQNFLFRDATGELIPIDFGYSFGTATQVLLIPELMPFRLTRQLLAVFYPHEGKDVLQLPMARVLHALRERKEVIEGIIQVFLREPILDWQREAQVLARIKGWKSGQGGVEHFEEKHVNLKVDAAKQKLRGRHPVDVMLNELEHRHNQKPYWEVLKDVVRGDLKLNIRCRIPSGFNIILSIPDQVECLVDQATDKNILGRTWWGWRPWV